MEDPEDYATNLATYKAQLQQVEAALTNDPENEELLKLKQDLTEVIDLTSDLIQAVPNAVISEEQIEELKEKWKVGDKCQACYSGDGGYYNAVIEEILEDGSVTVAYDGYETSEVVKITKLKPHVEDEEGATTTDGAGTSGNRQLSKKDLLDKQREYKK